VDSVLRVVKADAVAVVGAGVDPDRIWRIGRALEVRPVRLVVLETREVRRSPEVRLK